MVVLKTITLCMRGGANNGSLCKPKVLHPTQSRQSGDRTDQVKTKKIVNDRFRLNDTIQKIIQALKLFGYDDYEYSTSPTVDHWMKCCADTPGGFMPFMKYKLAAFYASCQGEFMNDPQEVPKSPFTIPDKAHCLLGGRAYNYIRLLSKNKEKFHQFLVTILQIKKGLERPDELMMDKGMLDTYNTLTTPPPPLEDIYIDTYKWADVDTGSVRDQKSLISLESITEEIKRTVDEVFGKHRFTDKERYQPFFPSTSANYINSRSKGGAVGEILNDKDLLKDLKYHGTKVIIQGDETSGYWMNDEDLNTLYKNWKTLYLRMFDKAITEIPYAEPVALAEALKVRVITKGPPMLNTVLKPLQKFLWSIMKDHTAFKLIGSWITTEYLAKVLGNTLDPNGRFAFLSVDYKDATNKLNGALSNICANAISDKIGLTDLERELFIRALTGHTIVNPSNKKESKPQLNGQLMGSIISFPILCLINATILRLVREIDCNRLFKLDKAGIMVNGDDGLFKATPEGKAAWEMIGAWCGLSPSVGKVYYSKRFFNINSTTFEYTHGVIQEEVAYGGFIEKVKWVRYAPGQVLYYKESVDDVYEKGRSVIAKDLYVKVTDERQRMRKIYFKLVKYINFGLLYDMSRSSSDDTNGTTSVTSIGERANELLRTCPVDMQEIVLSAYMGRHLKILKPLNVPWYLPEFLGGIGIKALPGTRHMPNQSQMRFAAKAYHFGFKFPKLRPTDNWKTWKLALQSLPSDRFSTTDIIGGSAQAEISGFMGKTEEESFLSNEKAWSLKNLRSTLVVETLFTHKLKDMLQNLSSKKSTIEMNFYRKLAKANQTIRKDTYHPELQLKSVRPFTVGMYPLPGVDTDDVQFVKSQHPSYDLLDDMKIVMKVMNNLDYTNWGYD